MGFLVCLIKQLGRRHCTCFVKCRTNLSVFGDYHHSLKIVFRTLPYASIKILTPTQESNATDFVVSILRTFHVATVLGTRAR